MRFNNIATKKESVKYFAGDVLIMYNETLGEEEAYMVFKTYSMYNLLDLDKGRVYFSENRLHDEFAREVGQIFTSAEIISNHELELTRVEE